MLYLRLQALEDVACGREAPGERDGGRPHDAAEKATAEVFLRILAGQLPPYTGKCMRSKLCLWLLAKASVWWTLDDEFTLHNNNTMQYECLSNPKAFEKTQPLANLRKLCKRFNQCMTRHGDKEQMIAILKAGLNIKQKSMLINMNTETSTTDMPEDDERPASDCWDPSVMDPEATECTCMSEWHAHCNRTHGNGSSYNRCIQCKMCEQSTRTFPLCKTWTEAANCKGCPSLMQVARHADTNTKMSMTREMHGSMDSTVQGKCGA